MVLRLFICLYVIVLYFTLQMIIVECNVNLADNANENNLKEPTFWLLQETKNYLYFEWTPFNQLKSDALKLNLKKYDITRQLKIDETASTLQTIGTSCINEEYTITSHVLYVGFFDQTISERKLNYKRVFRVQSTTIEMRNEKPAYITWKLNEKICNQYDEIVIFKKDSSGFHRMHIVSVNEREFYFDEILQDQEEIIITSYHDKMFGLSELGKSIEVTLITKNQSKNLNVTKKHVTEKSNTGHLNTAGAHFTWKIIGIGMIYLVIFICICICIYFTIKY
ncbi:unnamed protein product [Schistosoma margrebowiei]|uniref:Uncharacterized protein n=1 Tax=Schistosoma margrebowiei TaxID=48269 RepID=A0AA85AQX0_9TREM|nr:unnamed protein product [Schistosoma margrebowiei]